MAIRKCGKCNNEYSSFDSQNCPNCGHNGFLRTENNFATPIPTSKVATSSGSGFCTGCGSPKLSEGRFCPTCGKEYPKQNLCPTCGQTWNQGNLPVTLQANTEKITQIAEFAYGEMFNKETDCPNCGHSGGISVCSFCGAGSQAMNAGMQA